MISYFMILLDNFIIFTGLPQIGASMALSAAGLSWVENAYTLVFGGLLLLAARAGDLLGRRRVFIVGLALFDLASMLVGIASSQGWLIGARAIQGVAAAIVAPSSLALLTATFPPGPERNRAVAAYGTTAGIGASLGLVVGGALADWVSWRAGFFINVPIAVVLIAVGGPVIPRLTPSRGPFDFLGAVTSVIGTGLLVYGVVNAGNLGWAATGSIGPVAAGVAVLLIFVFNEWRATQPIMPLRLFAARSAREPPSAGFCSRAPR